MWTNAEYEFAIGINSKWIGAICSQCLFVSPSNPIPSWSSGSWVFPSSVVQGWCGIGLCLRGFERRCGSLGSCSREHPATSRGHTIVLDTRTLSQKVSRCQVYSGNICVWSRFTTLIRVLFSVFSSFRVDHWKIRGGNGWKCYHGFDRVKDQGLCFPIQSTDFIQLHWSWSWRRKVLRMSRSFRHYICSILYRW